MREFGLAHTQNTFGGAIMEYKENELTKRHRELREEQVALKQQIQKLQDKKFKHDGFYYIMRELATDNIYTGLAVGFPTIAALGAAGLFKERIIAGILGKPEYQDFAAGAMQDLGLDSTLGLAGYLTGESAAAQAMFFDSGVHDAYLMQLGEITGIAFVGALALGMVAPRVITKMHDKKNARINGEIEKKESKLRATALEIDSVELQIYNASCEKSAPAPAQDR